MSEQVWSETRKKPSDFHGGIRFQSRFIIRWELEDKNFLKIDIICLDDSLKYRIMATGADRSRPFSNRVTFRKPRRTDLVTASELIPGFCQSKSNVPTLGSLRQSKAQQGDSLRHQIPAPCPHSPPPTGFTLIGALFCCLPAILLLTLPHIKVTYYLKLKI